MNLLVAIALAGVPQGATVQVRLAGIATTGPIYVSLCTRDEYLRRCARQQRIMPRAGALIATFAAVPPGPYAVSALQDVNGNKRLDFGMSGAPSEPWGVSRGARGVMGPPGFNEVAVTVRSGVVTIPLTLAR